MNKWNAALMAYRALRNEQKKPNRDERRREALLEEYSEVSHNFRLLTDIRFKLLAFLPIATAVAAALINNSATAPGLAMSLFGLIVTLGLATYNMRNNQLYNELVGRAATIERSLGLPDGAFAHRPRAWLAIDFPWKRWIPWKKWEVNHETGVWTIYVASAALWLFGVFASVLEYVRRAYVGFELPTLPLGDSSILINLTAFILTVLFTYRAVKVIKRQSKDRSDSMEDAAKRAVQSARGRHVSKLQNHDPFLRACEELSGDGEEEIRTRLNFYASLDPDGLDFYMLRSSDDELSASSLVALLTDLPPRWIFDRATYRKGHGPTFSLAGRTDQPLQQQDGTVSRN